MKLIHPPTAYLHSICNLDHNMGWLNCQVGS